MRKINARSIESKNKVMLMMARAYNLEKPMKHQGRPKGSVLRHVDGFRTEYLILPLQI